MKILKYRAKIVGLNEWRFGLIRIDRAGHLFISDDDTNWYGCHKETLGQFAGLTDLSGNEIYDGDLITLDGKGPYQVTCNHIIGTFADRTNWAGKKRAAWSILNQGEKIVIGNIYDK